MNCALCGGEIAPRGGRLVSVSIGAAFFHPRCASTLERLRAKLAAAIHRASQAERQSAADRADAAVTRVKNMELETAAQRSRMQLKDAEANVRQLRDRLTAEHQSNRHDREEREQAMRRHAELLTENDRLRNELAVHRALGAQPAHASADPVKVEEDGKDPSVVRAELLELD